MATAVIDIDAEKIPPEINGLKRYQSALISIWLHGQVVGQVTVPVFNGCITGGELRETLTKAIGWPFWERWLHNYLGLLDADRLRANPHMATVAVCTRDRANELNRCLNALMNLDGDGHEILVVDNAPSSGATEDLVRTYSGRIRYLREDKPGLNVARNRALRQARHDIVAFADDDTAPDPGWLRALLANFNDPLVLCVTGLTVPLELETEAQEWFERYSSFRRGFRRIEYSSGNLHPLKGGRTGAGANMAIRRSVLELVGPFDEALDAGTPTCSGGDTEMFYRILNAGYYIIYDPAALSRHRHRPMWEELRQTLYGYGVGNYAFWTRCLLVEGELRAVKLAWDWFHFQLREILRSLLRRPQSVPLDLLLAELRGCAAGPRAYLLSRKQWRPRSKE
jgi:glycosyltransferase involved in cell wall biosynthesis